LTCLDVGAQRATSLEGKRDMDDGQPQLLSSVALSAGDATYLPSSCPSAAVAGRLLVFFACLAQGGRSASWLLEFASDQS
jgi:hypothetical protein